MTQAEFAHGALSGDAEIERKDTAIRILLSLLFAIIAALVESVLVVVVVFSLLWALVTKQPPGLRVRELSNQIVSYYYRIWRYLTYNEVAVPFPFSDLPEVLEPSRWSAEPHESEGLGLGRKTGPGADDEDESSGI